MIPSNYTNFRELARKPKEVITEVKKSKKAKVVMSKEKEPQAVIVSLEDYQEFEALKEQQKQKDSALALLGLAELGKKYPKSKKQTNALEEIDKMWQDWDK